MQVFSTGKVPFGKVPKQPEDSPCQCALRLIAATDSQEVAVQAV